MSKKTQKPLWGKFADAMLDNKRAEAEKIFAKMTIPAEIEDAKRWLYGKTKEQKAESRQRFAYIEAMDDSKIPYPETHDLN